MIKIATGFSKCGGSTIALAELCNLFNSNGLNCDLYGPFDWVKSKLKGDHYRSLNDMVFTADDHVIYHFIPIKQRPPCKKLILSCHETNVFPLKNVNVAYDTVHYVSKFQMDWQGIPGTIIPNILPSIKPKTKKLKNKVAGIIGSIDPHKNTHISIDRALSDNDISRVELWGEISDPIYFASHVSPRLCRKVSYCGVATDMQAVYDGLSCVYHSSARETFNYIKAECSLAEIDYFGSTESDPSAEYWTNEKILDSWINLLK